ncbi:endonuclease, partial [bacterium]|nr:endonuclease [bacterium]
MLRKCTIFILFVISSVFAIAAPPPGYYDSAAGLSGSDLKTALYGIINGHTVVSYDSLWTHFQATDKKANGKVWDMYSDIPGSPPYEYTFVTHQCGTYGAEGDCYNREHSFPSSWFAGASPMASDLFQLYPTDGYVNGMRANYAYGETVSPSWTSANGSKRGNCTYPGYTGVIFEPRDDYKGDFARAVFYMVTRYENLVAGWEPNDVNGDAVLDGTAYPALETWAVNMLIEWHANDPVSQKELDRNDAVYSIQSNRNPFIDNPQYVCDIWGGDCGLCDLGDITSPDWTPSGTSGLIALSLNEQIELDWSNASDPDNSITYSVYRSTTSSFTPDAGNLVISGLADSAYIDMG